MMSDRILELLIWVAILVIAKIVFHKIKKKVVIRISQHDADTITTKPEAVEYAKADNTAEAPETTGE